MRSSSPRWRRQRRIAPALACLALCGCTTVPPSASPPAETALAPIGPALDSLARQLIERVERESNCRYLLAGRSVSAPGSTFAIVLLNYRGPEVECRQGLELLNQHGATRGIAFVASRLRLASFTPPPSGDGPGPPGRGARHPRSAPDR